VSGVSGSHGPDYNIVIVNNIVYKDYLIRTSASTFACYVIEKPCNNAMRPRTLLEGNDVDIH
jgi:hypothetical protein